MRQFSPKVEWAASIDLTVFDVTHRPGRSNKRSYAGSQKGKAESKRLGEQVLQKEFVPPSAVGTKMTERSYNQGYMGSSFDDEDEGWDCLYSAESLVDEMDRLNDITDDLDCDFVYDLD